MTLLDAVNTPLLTLGEGELIVARNRAAAELLPEATVGRGFAELFSDPEEWARCQTGAEVRTELFFDALPVGVTVTLRPLPDGQRLATVVVHDARELITGLTQILTAGGDLSVLFTRLAPFVLDRLPFARLELAIWDEQSLQAEVYSRHPSAGRQRVGDQAGALVDQHLIPALLPLREQTQPLLIERHEPELAARLAAAHGVDAEALGPLCAIPLTHQRRYLGALTLYRPAGHGFSERERRQLEVLTGPLSLGVAVTIRVRELVARETSYRERYEEAPLMYHLIDKRGLIIDVNRREAEALGYRKEELIGQPLTKVLSGASAEQLEHALLEYQRHRRISFQGEREFVRKDGSLLYARLSSTVQYGDDGELVCVRTIVRDISQQKRIERRRMQAQKLEGLGRLIAGITHEFNNLLGPILGYAQILQRRLGDSAGKELAQIEGAASKARSILSSLLRFARQARPQKRYLDLVLIVKGAVELVAHRAQRHDIELEVESTSPAIWTRCDETQITQLLINLLNNSIDASADRKGRVRITLDQQGSWIQLVLRDDCGGIPEEMLAHLFDPFFSARAGGGGTGLGLATCFGIVAEHGGSIDASNSTLGGSRGARFEILLPVRLRSTAAIKRHPTLTAEAPSPPPDLRGLSALVIEDDQRYNQLVCQLLEDRGASATAVDAGDAARESLQATATPYDLIVCDVRLPGLSGLELLEWLREHRPQALPRVLLITGDTLDEASARALAGFGREPLGKPFEVEDFYRQVRELLAASGDPGARGLRPAAPSEGDR